MTREIDEVEADIMLCMEDVAHLLVHRYDVELPDDIVTPEIIDMLAACWLDDPEAAVEIATLDYVGTGKPPLGVVRDGLAAALGGYLIDNGPEGDARWVSVFDDLGTTYGLVRRSVGQLMYVFDLVEKRLACGERGIAPAAAMFLGDTGATVAARGA